jgi:L-ascorbate metabolism protein UlaG (beta-lactamase superfamily)
VLQNLGEIDVLTLPVDGSQHILSYEQGDEIVDRLAPKVVIPTHYLCEGVSLTLTTLQDANEWVDSQKSKKLLDSGSLSLAAQEVKQMDKEFMYFGSNTVIS